MAYEQQRQASGNPVLDAFTSALSSFTMREGYEDQRSDAIRGQIGQYDKQIADRMTGMLMSLQSEKDQADATKLYNEEVGRRQTNFNKAIAAVTAAKTKTGNTGNVGTGNGGSNNGGSVSQVPSKADAVFGKVVSGVKWLDDLLRDKPSIPSLFQVVTKLGMTGGPDAKEQPLYNNGYPVYKDDFNPNQKMNLGGY